MANDKIERLVNILIELKGADETERAIDEMYDSAKKGSRDAKTGAEEAEPKINLFLQRWKTQALTLAAALGGLWGLAKYSSVASGMTNMLGASLGLLGDMLLVHLAEPATWASEKIMELAEWFDGLPEPIQKLTSYVLGIGLAFSAPIILTAIYSIPIQEIPNYEIYCEGSIFTDSDFYNLRIERYISRIGFCEFDLVSDSGNLKDLIWEGRTIHVLLNDRLIYTGEITRTVEDTLTETIHIEAYSLAKRLQGRVPPVQRIYSQGETVEDIVTDIVPSGWKVDIPLLSLLDVGGMDYNLYQGAILMHIATLARLAGWDWDLLCDMTTVRVASFTSTEILLQTRTLTPGEYAGTLAYVRTGALRRTSVVVAANTDYILTIEGGPEGLVPGDMIGLIGPPTVRMTYTTNPDAVRTYQDQSDVIMTVRVRDVEEIRTVAIARGLVGEAAGNSATLAAAHRALALMGMSEGTLTAPISAGETDIILSEAPSYDLTPGGSSGLVRIENETIRYTGTFGQRLTGVTRGYSGTTAAAHSAGTSVIRLDALLVLIRPVTGLRWNPVTGQWVDYTQVPPVPGFGALDDLPAAGSAWVGMERISYTSRTYVQSEIGVIHCWLRGLTRGVGGTPVYTHKRGVWVRDGQFSNGTPEPESPLDLYGVREIRIDSGGVMDRSGLDLLVQSVIRRAAYLVESGTTQLVQTDFDGDDVQVGQHFTIADATRETTHRIAGILYDQMSGMVTLEFGNPSKYLEEKFSQIDQAVEIAGIRNE
jgi:hypothetical protein